MASPFDVLNGTYKPLINFTKAEADRMKAKVKESERMAAKEREAQVLKDAGPWSHTGSADLKTPTPRNKASQKWKEK